MLSDAQCGVKEQGQNIHKGNPHQKGLPGGEKLVILI